MLKIKSIVIFFGVSLCMATPALSADINSSLKVVGETNKDAISTQKRIDRLSLQTQKMLEEYQVILRKTDYEDAYNAQLERLKEDQEEEIRSLQEQASAIDETQLRIMPLMTSMADALEKFVVLDIPFRQQERIAGVIQLKQRLRDPSLSVPDKYRILLEAFQIENEYGRSIEAYRDTLNQEGESLSVEHLRVGRLALYYRTLDGEKVSYWNSEEKSWQPLEDKYIDDLAVAFRVAQNQVAPKLISLPLVNVP